MTAAFGMRWVRGSFIIHDRSDDDNGLDRTIGKVLMQLAETRVATFSVSSADSDLDGRVAAVLAGLFRENTPLGSVWHARVGDGTELHIVFEGTGSGAVIDGVWEALAEEGVEGQVESVEIGFDGPAFTRTSVEGGVVRVDDAGRVVYTG